MDDRLVVALFRHFITEENKRKAYLGWSDSPLILSGKEERVTAYCDQLYSSDLNRCVQTASILFPNQQVKLCQGLREMNFGEWEGLTFVDLEHNVAYRQWIEQPLVYSPPSGESFSLFAQRVDHVFQQIRNEAGENRFNRIAIVTHGGVIRHLLSKHAPSRKAFWDWNVTHDCGYELHFSKESGQCISLQEVPIMVKGNG